MDPADRQFSLFSRSIDRAVFAAYFLGAVVPLLALGYVTERYVLPVLPPGPLAYGFVALLGCVGVLCLGAFLVLRAVAKDSLAQLGAHNRHLETLLDATRSVADARYGGEVCRVVAEAACDLAGAAAAFVVVWGEKEGGGHQLAGTAGENAEQLYAAHAAALEEVLEQARAGGDVLVGGGEAWRGESAPVLLIGTPLGADGVIDGAIVAVASGRPRDLDAPRRSALSTLAALASVARHNADLRDSERNFFTHVTEILVNTLDVMVDEQKGHGRRVANHCGVVGRELGFDDSQLERLYFAGLLHDIGMLRIDPRTATPSVYQQHATLGYRMLKPIRIWKDIAPLVLHHHEWFNGRGYPEGLSGESIPLESRIIAVVEAFDSMTSPKSYQPTLPLDEAMEEIRRGAGTQFDPTVARVFVELAQAGALQIESAG